MSLAIPCPECGELVSADAAPQGAIHRCPKCEAEFEVLIHVAPRTADEVVAQVVDDDSDPASEVVGEALVTVESAMPAESSALSLAAAPAPRRSGAISADDVASANIEDDRIARYRAQYAKETKVPVWGWVATASISVLPVLAWAWNLNGIRDGFADPQVASSQNYQNLQHAKFRAEDEEAAFAEIYQAIEFGTVKIETRDQSGRVSGVGSGFVIDRQGLVATSLHVLSDSVTADVIFNDGTRFAIEGYAAINPASDLAIVKLAATPPKMTVMGLSTGKLPEKASRVVAIGHPQNHAFVPTSGVVDRVVRSSELPELAQKFLHYSPDEQDNVWIEHDAPISPGSSGGPLVDYRGAVLGINSWVNSDIKRGYALHIKHLQTLKSAVTQQITPLSDYKAP